jgi:glycosyltransferase involved in cell wall biosynthesis
MQTIENNIIVLMPCFNEEARVGKVLSEVRKAATNAEIVVIDDCSSDGSANAARRNGATVLSHFCNLGYGAALQTGYKYALSRDFQAVIQLDADGQHDPESIPALSAMILQDKADLCLGSRHLSAASDKTPAIRRAGQKIFALAIRLFGGPALTDPTSGFQALNRKAVTLFANDVFPCDYPDSDVMLMAHYAGLRIKEIPVRMFSRSGGVSIHSGLKPLYYGIKMLFSMLIVLLNRGQWKRLGAELTSDKSSTKREDL